MRIYEGSPRKDYEEVLRSVGAYLDDKGMREIVFLETDVSFIIQGLVIEGTSVGWGDSLGQARKETLQLADDDVGTFMDEALAGRGAPKDSVPDRYESALRVIGRYVDEQQPRDVFFFEQEGAYVLRLLRLDQTGIRHELVEFTKDDVAEMIARAPALRRGSQAPASRR
ncbi:MAG TPA: hypothetical protein VKR30_02140 [Candidatus Limnocylindrales bacterium]|nr:hypothetical protein [Candidatus Limnocylindrales bacterium]